MNKDVTPKASATDSEKLSLILTTVQSLTVRFDNVDTQLNTIDSRLVRVEHTVNEMQPVLQKAVTDIAQLQQGQRELQEGQLRLRETVLQIQDGQRHLQTGQERLATEVYALSHDVSERFLVLSGATAAEVRSLTERVTHLEREHNPPKPQT